MDYKNEISDRIKKLMEEFGGNSPSKFGKIFGRSESNIRTYTGQKNKISMPGADFIGEIIDKLGISSDWILFGRGEMIPEKTYQVTQIFEPDIPIVQKELEQAKKLIGTLQKTLDIINREFSKTNEELEALRIENSRLKNMLADKQYRTGSYMVAETPPELDNNSSKE